MPIDCDQFITKHINLLLLLFSRLILVHHILFRILGRCEAIAKKCFWIRKTVNAGCHGESAFILFTL